MPTFWYCAAKTAKAFWRGALQNFRAFTWSKQIWAKFWPALLNTNNDDNAVFGYAKMRYCAAAALHMPPPAQQHNAAAA